MDFVWLLFSFRGRINRARYLAVQFALLTFWLILWLKFSFEFSSPWQTLAVTITTIWINAATTAKRLHDHNRSGWWTVGVYLVNHLSYAYYGLFFGLYFSVDVSIARELLLVMLAVALCLLQTCIAIELFFLIGTEGRNRFGLDPLSHAATGAATDWRPDQHGVPAFLVQRAELRRGSQRRQD